MATTVDKKIKNIYLLLERLAKGEALYPQNEALQEAFFGEVGEAQERALRRYLKEIHELYGHIVLTEKVPTEFSDRKVTVYRVVDKKRDVSEILKYFIDHSSDLSWLLQLVHENDPSILENMQDRQTLEANIKADNEIFLFKSNPLETLDTHHKNKLFSQAKMAVKNREYHTIQYHYKEKETLHNVKCLKLIFMSNNWYLAIEEDENLRFLRLSFIDAIHYATDNTKSNYQIKVLEKYHDFFQTLQNPMTLNIPFQSARLKASPRIAIYFKEKMKPFFPSQKFIQENDDGSVEFSIDYTQSIEVLPFIKQWQPDLLLLSPKSLKEELLEDMKKSVELLRV